tara:strand:+ start:283222 stop:283857 length:636 start_codon:yes stop_codon:yes gene_type:complete
MSNTTDSINPIQRSNPMPIEPVTLSNDVVTLEPLSLSHCSDITQAIDPDVFMYMPMRSAVVTNNQVRRYIEFQMQRDNAVVFAVIDHATGRAVGSTSYMNIRHEHYGLEIGSTWISKSSRGTKINPSMKYLMLKHAIEDLGAIRVELRTDARNMHSRAAILKLGASYEGLMRNHIIMPDGHFRETAVYTITPEQWDDVSQRLIKRISNATV